MDDALKIVQTKATQRQRNNDFEAVIFSNKKTSLVHKKKTEGKLKTQSVLEHNKCEEFDIKKATKDIIKFGAKGFYQRRRDKTLRSLAIELGAKPERRRCHNYKKLKEIKKLKRERKEKRLNLLKECSDLAALNRYKRQHKSSKKSNINILKSYGKRK